MLNTWTLFLISGGILLGGFIILFVVPWYFHLLGKAHQRGKLSELNRFIKHKVSKEADDDVRKEGE